MSHTNTTSQENSGCKKTIWSVAGGKGGTGKSFFSACLGIQLAKLQGEATLIDADLGAPNLHTFLGIRHPTTTIADFLYKKVGKLDDTATDTPIPGLKLIRGTNDILYMANLKYAQKQKLIRHIKRLSGDNIIIDVGTGTSYNCIDFFIVSTHGILVVAPDPTSVENVYQFLRSTILRILKLTIKHYHIQDLIMKAAEQRDDAPKSIYGLLNLIYLFDRRYGQLLYNAVDNFRPSLIVNMVKNERDMLLGKSMVDIVKKYLAVNLRFLGVIPYDERVRSSLQRFSPFITTYPNCKTSAFINIITKKLIEANGSNHPI